MSSWYLRVLGRPELWWDGQKVELRLSGRLWAILTYLALESAPVTREKLALEFWSASEVNDPRGHLRVALATLKKSLPEEMCLGTKAEIALPQGGACDLQQLRDRVAQAGHSEEPGVKCSLLREAALPIQGFFLEGRGALGVWGDRIFGEVLEEQVTLLEQLLTLQREQEDTKGAVTTARLLKYLSPEHSLAKEMLLSPPGIAALQEWVTVEGLVKESLKKLDKDRHPQLCALAVFPDVFTHEQAQAITGATEKDLAEFRKIGLIHQSTNGLFLAETVQELLWRKLTGEHQRRLSLKHADYFIDDMLRMTKSIGDKMDEAKKRGQSTEEIVRLDRVYYIYNAKNFEKILENNIFYGHIDGVKYLYSETWWRKSIKKRKAFKYLDFMEYENSDIAIRDFFILVSESLRDYKLERYIDDYFNKYNFDLNTPVGEESVENFKECLGHLMLIFHGNGNREQFDRCVALRQELAQKYPQYPLQPHNHYIIAESYMARRRFAEAAPYNQCYLDYFRTDGAIDSLGLGILQQGMILKGLGQVQEARRCWNEALILLDKAGNIHEKGRCFECLAILSRESGLIAEALEYILRARDLYQQSGDEAAVAASGGTWGDILLELGQREQARELYEEGLAFWKARKHPSWTERFEIRLAKFEAVSGTL